MGQLEVYNINETILSGFITTVSNNYISESNESSTFESYKAYFYSGNIITKKLRKNTALKTLSITIDNGIYTNTQFINFTNIKIKKLTKIIDDFTIWQNNTLVDTKIDENIVKLQNKYNLE